MSGFIGVDGSVMVGSGLDVLLASGFVKFVDYPGGLFSLVCEDLNGVHFKGFIGSGGECTGGGLSGFGSVVDGFINFYNLGSVCGFVEGVVVDCWFVPGGFGWSIVDADSVSSDLIDLSGLFLEGFYVSL